MLESMGETGTQGCMLKLASDRAFHLWHQFERDEISRKQLIRDTKPIQDEIRQRLEILRDGPDTTKKARGHPSLGLNPRKAMERDMSSVGIEKRLWAPPTRASVGPEALFNSNELPRRREGPERLRNSLQSPIGIGHSSYDW